ncbi:MAG: fructosamine kinase family protein [Rhodothermales bacterium]
MTEQLKSDIEAYTGSIQHIRSVGGGCIANASCVEAGNGRFFLKWGGPEATKTFGAEAAGLTALRQADTSLKIPVVIGFNETGDGFLLLEWLETGSKPAGFDEAFGMALAQMHRHTGKAYGFNQDNYIGSTAQINTWHDNWPAFFQTCRLEPQVRLARQGGHWSTAWDQGLQRLYNRLPDLLPATPVCSMLHGDLWGGNYMVTAEGQAALFDPASYYGHRETDLAMTEMFGGFDARFYDAYREAWSLEADYETRRSIYNLYHQLNHLNLFGSGYAAGVARVLGQF